jgi:hypothetical protein
MWIMKTKLFLLIAICYLPIALFSQTSQTGSDYIARRVQIPLLDAPQKVQNASVFVSGNPGPATYYYWIVTNGLIGASSPAGPFQIGNAPNTLTGSNFNQISWNSALGAVSFDVLRTSNPSPPFGACNCAVATAVAGSSTTDQANALNAYTVNTFDPSTVVWAITNESVSAGVSQITFRAGGFAKFSLASNGAAVTLPTPFTAPAHQFLTALSGGGAFSSAQPASADISDGTGTGVVVRQTNAALTTPNIGDATGTSITSGLNPAATGILRVPNNTAAISARTQANTGDFGLIKLGTDNLTHLIGGGADFIIPLASDTAVGKATTDTLTNKTLTSPTFNTGVTQGSGLKHQRFGSTCTTAAAAGNGCGTVYTWASGFADTSYTVVCQGEGNVGNTAALFISSRTATQVTVTTVTFTASAVSFSTVDCIAVHD